MLGYWEDPERTAEAIDADGWMHTGDLATMDDDGYLKIVGRIKDMVIRGGENVYPREVEEFLYAPPGRRRRAGDRRARRALRRGADGLGDRRREGADCEPEDAARVLPRARSPTTRCRATCEFVDEFPMTVTGKVQKFKLREQAIEELGLAATERSPA